MISFHQETMDRSLDDIKTCFQRHWEELARNRTIIPLDPDYIRYKNLEKLGHLRVYTVRQGDILRGYAVYFVDFHLHYKMTKWAISDIFWVDPVLRSSFQEIIRRKLARLLHLKFEESVGAGFFAFITEQLTKDGVNMMHTTYKCAHPAPGKILKRLGHVRIEHGHAKMLNRG